MREKEKMIMEINDYILKIKKLGACKEAVLDAIALLAVAPF